MSEQSRSKYTDKNELTIGYTKRLFGSNEILEKFDDEEAKKDLETELSELFKPTPMRFKEKALKLCYNEIETSVSQFSKISELLSNNKDDVISRIFYLAFFKDIPISINFHDAHNTSYIEHYGMKNLSNCKFEFLSLKTFLNLKKKFKDKVECFILDFIPYLVFKNKVILTIECINYFGGYSPIMYLPSKIDRKFLREILEEIELKPLKNKSSVQYLIHKQNGYNLKQLDIKKTEINISENYNSDIPDKQIVDFLNSNESGIAILHGHPGTGKSTYIRNLIYRTDREFIFLDKNVLMNMGDSSLIDLFLEHKNAIIVLEDCEDLIAKGRASNTFASTILNLSDGIIGDSMKFKFICTFNIDIGEIDDAILRKGRMKIKYEFKELSEDKTRALIKKLYPEAKNIDAIGPLPLSEIYNYTVDNGNRPKKKMGF